MKKPKFELDPYKFYRTGKYLFFVVGLMGVVRMLDMWSQWKAYDLISATASTLFQFALFAFFAYLQGKADEKELNDGDLFKMNEALEKLELGKTKDVKKG